MTETKSFHIAVIGGGIAGLTLAISLNRRNIPCTVYEQAPQFGEIGAGVSFSPNAVQAMEICDPGIHAAFEEVCSRNVWPSKQNVWFDFLDGFHYRRPASGEVHQEAAFTITNTQGQNGVHRAAFLDEMVPLLPKGLARFGKRLSSISRGDNGKMVMHFEDGSTDEADAVVGCDGIKSRTRWSIVPEDHPAAKPVYTHKYAYRGLIPMEKAVEVLGAERAHNACMHMGPGGHILTFSVNHGKTLNLVAFRTQEEDWPDYARLTRPGKREDALREFEGYGPSVVGLLQLCKEELDVWAIFDLPPLPQYYSPDPSMRVLVSGDAAHATSPHHGAGAGFAIEDSAVLSHLLSDPRVQSPDELLAVFKAFDACRRERTQWLVDSSRRIGNLYEWRADGAGDDISKVGKEVKERTDMVWDVDVEKMCEEARDVLGSYLEDGKVTENAQARL